LHQYFGAQHKGFQRQYNSVTINTRSQTRKQRNFQHISLLITTLTPPPREESNSPTLSTTETAELLLSLTTNALTPVPSTPPRTPTPTPTNPQIQPMPQSENTMSQATIPMPLWNKRAALTFDSTKPWELPHFFKDVEQLFDCANVTNELEKKQYVVRYVDYSMEQMWKTFPKFKSAKASYNKFKKAILVHYPDAAGDFIYLLCDMDILIGERYRKGIMTSVDLSDYHLQFVTITSWLIEKNQLGILEQQQAYVWAFQPQLLWTTSSSNIKITIC
jgi:hypothetical protein